MTHDGPNNVDLSYNVLNLTEKVSRDESTLAKYSYLSDGTKLSATDSGGNGLVYLGSLVYRRQAGALSLESASFSGGRFVATVAGLEPFYHLTDHLGSVRVVSDVRGNVFERNDYFPYGLRWENPVSLLSDNRHRYNGKEEQAFVGLPYTDYGARMRDPRFRPNDWNGVDPLAEKTPGVSPFMFCNGNPVVNVDVDGRDWVCRIVDGRLEIYYDREVTSQVEVVNKYGADAGMMHMADGTTLSTYDKEGNVTSQYTFTNDGKKNRDGKVMDVNGKTLDNNQITTGESYSIFGTSDNSVNAESLHKNLFDSSYIGPKNPKDYNGNDSYQYKPIWSPTEMAAYMHDKQYDALGVRGLQGTLGSKTKNADIQLMLSCCQIIKNPNSSVQEKTRARKIVTFFAVIYPFKL